jgi:hypothetical protein
VVNILKVQVVRLKKTGEFASIVGKNNLMNRPDTFLNYYLEIEGRQGTWAGYDDDFELEYLPANQN